MNLTIIRINGILHYSHHKSNIYPGIWYKKYRVDGSFVLIYDEIISGLAVDQPYELIGKKHTLIIELVQMDFWGFVRSENSNIEYSQLKIAI